MTYLICELGQQLRVEKEVSGGGEFVCHCIQKDFGAVVFVGLVGALLRLDCSKTHADYVRSVAEEDCISACTSCQMVFGHVLYVFHNGPFASSAALKPPAPA